MFCWMFDLVSLGHLINLCVVAGLMKRNFLGLLTSSYKLGYSVTFGLFLND